MMEFHPSQIPAIKTFEIDNEKSATIAADQMVNLGFEGIKGGEKDSSIQCSIT